MRAPDAAGGIAIARPAARQRFSRQTLDEVLALTCARLGLDSRGASLVRFTNNAVYSLAAEQVVVRIVGSRALRHRAHKAVLVAEHLASNGVPATRLVPGLRQPLNCGEHVVTVWQRVPDTGRQASGGQLGELLRKMHALAPPEVLEAWAPVGDVRARIADAEELDADDRRFLLRRCAEVEAALHELEPMLPHGLVHGDAHTGNVIVGTDGPVLCDFDSACVGPPEWDLTPLAVGRSRFGDPAGRYRMLADTYGFDVTGWAGFEALRAARELKLATSVLPILRSNRRVAEQLRRRIGDLRAGRTDTRWQRFG